MGEWLPKQEEISRRQNLGKRERFVQDTLSCPLISASLSLA